MLESVLDDSERVLGDNHPDTLLAWIKVAGAYRAAGHLHRAIALSERTLADCERVLSSDHPHCFSARNNLALAYHAAGDLLRAITLCSRALSDYRRVLGGHHAKTRIVRNNLAHLRRRLVVMAGRYDLGASRPVRWGRD